ncbi:MAG: hypothetical protein WBK28_00010 [Minisyncoccia bacterium]
MALALVACDKMGLGSSESAPPAEIPQQSAAASAAPQLTPEQVQALLALAANAPDETPAQEPAAPTEPQPEVAAVQVDNVRYTVERDVPVCAEFAFEAVSMTPTERSFARTDATRQACATGARLPIADGIIDLPTGRRIHFNARAVPSQ